MSIAAAVLWFAMSASASLAAELEVLVVDNTSGQPLEAECEVRFLGPSRALEASILRTDPAGRCRAPGPGTVSDDFRLTVRKPGFARQVRTWSRNNPGNRIPRQITIELSPGSTIGGVLRNPRGQPLPGITLELMANADQIHPESDPNLIASMKDTVTTDAKGGWKSQGMPAVIQSVRMQVVGPVLIPATMTWDGSSTAFPAILAGHGVVTIHDNFRMQGTVSDSDGHPIAGVRLAETRGIEPPRPLAITDAKGHFEVDFRYWPSQLLDLTAQCPGYVPGSWSGQLKPSLPPLILKLEKAFTLKGRVIDPQRQPVAKVTVAIADPLKYSYYLPYTLQTETDAQGVFSLADLPRRELAVDFHKEGLVARRRYPVRPVGTEQVIEMMPLLKIRATVVEADSGQPLGSVTLTPAEVDPLATSSGQTNAEPPWGGKEFLDAREGFFTYTFKGSQATGREPPPPCLLKCEGDGYLPAISRRFEASEGVATWAVTLRRTPDITGLIRTPEGAPAKDAVLSFSFGAGGPGIFEGRITPGTRPASDAKGRYHLRALRDRAVIILHDQGWFETNTRQLMTHADVGLLPWGAVKGQCLLGTNAAPGQSLQLIRHRQTQFLWRWHTTTDESGRFEFFRVPSGEVTLFSSSGPNPRSVGFDFARENFTLKLGETAQIQIHGSATSGK